MRLSKKAVEEFQQIYEDEYGQKINTSDAFEMGTRLLNLMKAIYRPIPQMQMDIYKNGK